LVPICGCLMEESNVTCLVGVCYGLSSVHWQGTVLLLMH